MKFDSDTLALFRGDSGAVSLVGTYLVGGSLVGNYFIGGVLTQLPVGSDEATWAIQDSTVVRIDTARHLVTGLRGGNTVITASNGKLKAQIQVVVNQHYWIRILPGGACSRLMSDGVLQAHQYIAELYDEHKVRMPDEPATWISNDTTVATISATGLQRNKTAGETFITATIRGESAWSWLYVDPAPLGTPMTCGGIFPATSKSDTSSVRMR
jgi:hypothetical protein